MKRLHNFLFLLCFSLFCFNLQSSELKTIKVAALAYGTASWELQHIKNQRLDHKNSFNLEIVTVANMAAAKLAFTSGSVDSIVSDWIWAAGQQSNNKNLAFIPFSTQIGTLIASNSSNFKTLKDLKGARIGVAGGPNNKGWKLLDAAAMHQGMDLKKESTIQYAAPPLLSQALKNDQIDLLVTFWHYGARLEAEGYRRFSSLAMLMKQMGFESELPMLGYIFEQRFTTSEPQLVNNFYKTTIEAKQQLKSDIPWQRLKPLMRAENRIIYSALKEGYRAGTPGNITQQQIDEAIKFHRLITAKNSSLTDPLPANLFYRSDDAK